MIVVLPVAGRGSRFGAATQQIPKCLLPVATFTGAFVAVGHRVASGRETGGETP